MELLNQKRLYSIGEYVRFEQDATEKHEYRFGEIIAMAGGSLEHSAIILNAGAELRNALKGKDCRAFESNLRIRIPRTPLYVYPDLSVICGPPQYDPDDFTHQSITNPRLIVEVLSPSTEGYDRGEKFNRYRQVASFQEYVLVAQNAPSVQTLYRQPDGSWTFTPYEGLDGKVTLRSLGIELPMAEIYAGVELPAPPDATEISA